MKLVCFALFGEPLGRGDQRWPEVFRWHEIGSACTVTGEHPVRAPQPEYPPLSEVADLWERALPVEAPGPVREWCAARYLDLSRVRGRDLARSLPRTGLPRWARGPMGDWGKSGHLALVPIYDALAFRRSVRARLVIPSLDREVKKCYPPLGHRVGGLVMADPLFREVLTAGPGASPAKVVIVEGEPDFLTWATAWQENDPGRHAVCGVFSGSWSSAFSARLPPGSLVIVRTHADSKGHGYARDILQTLDPASLNVFHAPAGSTHVAR